MRSDIKSPGPSQGIGVFTKLCLFCNQAKKRIKGKEQEFSSGKSKNFEQNIRKCIEWQGYQTLSVRLSNVIFAEKEINYHGICRVKYQTAAEAKIKHKKK